MTSDSRSVGEHAPDNDANQTAEQTDAPVPIGPFQRSIFIAGSAGLLIATVTDSIGVLGRHTGIPLLGAIEVVQCAIVVIASAAMVGATLQRAHASVHIFTERMKPETARALDRFTSLLGALLFGLVVLGSAWVASDLWNGHERTELLHVPLRVLRALWIGGAATVCALFVRQAIQRAKQ
jgi:TRAP-type C4-dicarboxylate transport system permease small subunit